MAALPAVRRVSSGLAVRRAGAAARTVVVVAPLMLVSCTLATCRDCRPAVRSSAWKVARPAVKVSVAGKTARASLEETRAVPVKLGTRLAL